MPAEPPGEFAFADRADVYDEPVAALEAVTGIDRGTCERAFIEAWLPDPIHNDLPAWWPRERLMRLVAAVATLARPAVTVEVGVARGYSSAAILGALEANSGKLFSIDLPPLEEDREFVGAAVPERMREHWELNFGPSRTELPGLLRRLGSIDFFFHDGDHSAESQREDLEAAWPYLGAGGVVVVDDIWTPAVFDFAENLGEAVTIALGEQGHDAIALIRKS